MKAGELCPRVRIVALSPIFVKKKKKNAPDMLSHDACIGDVDLSLACHSTPLSNYDKK